MVLSEIVYSAIVKVVGLARFSPYIFAASLLQSVIVASIVSWLGMAIPYVVRGVGFWGSDEKQPGGGGTAIRVFFYCLCFSRYSCRTWPGM